VEFDHDGDGLADGSAEADDAGRFFYRPAGLVYGPVALRARAGSWDESSLDYVYGDWVPTSFTYEEQTDEAPRLVALGLANDTGSSSTDAVTSDPGVAGRVTDQRDAGGVFIEFDWTGDGTADATAMTGAYGGFTHSLADLPAG